ncbi:uncharacterized protein ACO6RY_00273 [Pungitius sinensis]
MHKEKRMEEMEEEEEEERREGRRRGYSSVDCRVSAVAGQLVGEHCTSFRTMMILPDLISNANSATTFSKRGPGSPKISLISGQIFLHKSTPKTVPRQKTKKTS